MRRVLIVGAGSYVGTSVQKHLEQWPDRFEVSVVDTLGGDWEKADFSAFDTGYHVAGIAHSDVKKYLRSRNPAITQSIRIWP